MARRAIAQAGRGHTIMEGMPQWESWVERQIREATQRGEFDNLPGVGKPLDLGDPDDPDWWIKRKLAAEQIDDAPPSHPTLALRREAATYPGALADVRDEAQARELIADYNRRVVEDRRRPVAGRAMPPVAPRLDPEEMVAAWRRLRADREEAQESRDAPPAPPATGRRRPWWRRAGRTPKA